MVSQILTLPKIHLLTAEVKGMISLVDLAVHFTAWRRAMEARRFCVGFGARTISRRSSRSLPLAKNQFVNREAQGYHSNTEQRLLRIVSRDQDQQHNHETQK